MKTYLTGVVLSGAMIASACNARSQENVFPDWLAQPWTQTNTPQADLGPALGLCLGLTIVVGGMMIIHACKPKVHCVGDGTTNWCTFASRRTLASDPDLHVSSTNYPSMKMCQKCCGISDRTGTGPLAESEPLYQVTVTATTDQGKTWAKVGSDIGPINNWQVIDRNPPKSDCMYWAYAEPVIE